MFSFFKFLLIFYYQWIIKTALTRLRQAQQYKKLLQQARKSNNKQSRFKINLLRQRNPLLSPEVAQRAKEGERIKKRHPPQLMGN